MVKKKISFRKKLVASIGYGLSGLILMFMNKIVLTTYMFPYYSIMALMQVLSISMILFTLKKLKIVLFPNLSFNLIKQLFPIPIFYLINLLTGLGATKYISVPMFVALRRLTIPLTIVLQYYILKIHTSKRAMFAVFILILGSLIAIMQDFQFNLLGYFLCLVNDVGDSCEAIFCKRQLNLKKRQDEMGMFENLESPLDIEKGDSNTSHSLNSLILKKYDKNQNLELYKKNISGLELDDKYIGKVAIIYYCALLNIVPLCVVVYFSKDLYGALEFDYWSDTLFTLIFISCSFFSLIFLLTWITCTDFNSPLLSQIISVMRSILSTYIGMYVGGDYTFNVTNFFGLNLSMLGAFLYTYFAFSEEYLKEANTMELEKSNSDENEDLIV